MHKKSINVVWISVSDLKQSQEFFTKTLGFDVKETEGDWIELESKDGGARLGLGHGPGYHLKPGANAVIMITVDDIEATKTFMEQRGVKFFGGILEFPDVKMATFIDPDGNMFQLAQVMK